MKVYQAINAVQTELAKTGISKTSRNNQGSGYNFRGIDDVYNHLSSVMATHGLCIIPRMLSRSCETHTSKNGGTLFYVVVEAEFDLVSAEDGSKHIARTFGEAMDTGDKATNKAMSAAYKYMAFQTFAIPTEGDNDADSQTHEVANKAAVSVSAATMMAHLADIEDSANSDEMMTAYKLAWDAANGDVTWQAKIIAAKKARQERARKEKEQSTKEQVNV